VATIEATKRGTDGKPAKDTRWRARYRDPNGRPRKQVFDRKVDAEAFLERTGCDVRSGEWIDPQLRRALFDDWAAAWWATTVKLAPSTRRRYYQLLHNDVLPFFGGRRLAAVDFMDVEEFIASLLARELSPKVARDATSVVSLVMTCAVASKVRRDNPAAGHRISRRRKKIRPGDVLDMPELRRLIDHVRDPYKPAVWLLVLTGMRPSELAGLRVGSVDFARRRLSIDTALVPVHRFGDEPFRLVEGLTKTEAGDRDIPIPEWLSDELAAMLATRGRPVHRDEQLFTQPKGGPLNVKWFREFVVRPALRAAGLPESIRTYDVRHSHASLLIDAGASPVAVAHRLGHTDPGMTLRLYTHLFEGVQEQLTDQLDVLARAPRDEPAVVALDEHRRSAQ
jgi:integrase